MEFDVAVGLAHDGRHNLRARARLDVGHEGVEIGGFPGRQIPRAGRWAGCDAGILARNPRRYTVSENLSIEEVAKELSYRVS